MESSPIFRASAGSIFSSNSIDSPYALDDRPTGITYQNAVHATPNVSFSYDAWFPRLTAMTDGTGTSHYTYGAVGAFGALQRQQETLPVSGTSAGATITYAYDALGRVTSRTAAGSSPETFQYDAIGRLVTHGGDLGSFTLAYLGQTGQITSRALNGSSLATTWSYLPNSGDRRLSGIANAGFSSGQYTNFTFATNVINQITGLTQSSDATPATPTAVSQTASFNALNQISAVGSQSYSYDANGNLTADGTRTYTWDAENRLISVATTGGSGQSLSFSYDGFGRRTSIATTPSGGATVTATYLWCGLTLCQARDATAAVTRAYLDEGEYLAGSSPKSLYYGLDQIGSVRRVFASDGTAPAYDYDPYGNPLQSTAGVTDYGYASLFTAGTSGLNLATFRAYDPSTGRWISRDPIGERGDPSGNLYGYVGQNPLLGADPDGRCPICALAAGAAAGAGIDLAIQLLHNGGRFDCINWTSVGVSAALGAGGQWLAGRISPTIARLLGGIISGEIAGSGLKTLYRAVGPAELEDILATGTFRNLGSAEGKYFTTSGEAASSYAKQAVKAFGDEPYTIVQTQVPNSILKGIVPTSVDRGIPTWVIPNARLPGMTPKVLPYSPVPGAL